MSGLATEFAARIRRRERAIGYWSALDAPVATERIGRLGYDYVVLDGQHGLIGYSGILNGLMAVDAGGQTVGLVRVEDNHLTPIGRALDAGAAGVIVPLVSTPAEAAAAVSATRYPPAGRRSYGPMRSALRIGPRPNEANAGTLVFVMIETREGLENVEAICRTPGLDGVYVGPSDLVLGLGGAMPGDPAVAEEFETALRPCGTPRRRQVWRPASTPTTVRWPRSGWRRDSRSPASPRICCIWSRRQARTWPRRVAARPAAERQWPRVDERPGVKRWAGLRSWVPTTRSSDSASDSEVPGAAE